MKLILVGIVAALLFVDTEAQKKSHHHRQRSKAEVKRINEHKSARRSAAYNQEPSNALVLRTHISSSPVQGGGGGPPPQNPPVLDALDILRGRPPLTAKEAFDVLAYAQGGKDFPVYLEVPKTYFTCGNAKPGFYADLDTYCQVYHRCDIGGKQATFLCPTKTLFNQITLVCDWFYNVNCQNSRQFTEYSNSRLYYPQWQVLDTQSNYVLPFLAAPQVVPAHPPPQQQHYHEERLQRPQPPPVLYPGKQPIANQAYGSGNINGHENPEYQMSVVIRNPQMIPDYNAGESSLVNKELHLDQGATVTPAPPSTFPLETRGDLGMGQQQMEQAQQAWRQQFRHDEEAAPPAPLSSSSSTQQNPNRPTAKAPTNQSINVTVSLSDPQTAAAPHGKFTQAASTVQEQTA
ncbi:hypothetical protein BV898_04937 [Hypsibius exemplaris]|uniref:Chitin-binding type-2 domain-containing protein n=1 Tax=Hypsibius exemplaris TaxID=2072580 RepID=A0A1W0X107_HYPEX|nr:hypothetical protein BV898_04937 [Hypsibius exemplaris]